MWKVAPAYWSSAPVTTISNADVTLGNLSRNAEGGAKGDEDSNQVAFPIGGQAYGAGCECGTSGGSGSSWML